MANNNVSTGRTATNDHHKEQVYVSAAIEGPVDAVWGRACHFANCDWMSGVSNSAYLGKAAFIFLHFNEK